MPSALRRSVLRVVLPVFFVGGLAASAFAQRGKPSPTPKPSPAATPTPPPQYVLPDPVATINGQPITRADLEHVTEMYLTATGRTLKNYSVADQKKAYRTMLYNLIVDRLVSSQAIKEDVPPLEVEKRLGEIRSQYPSDVAFENEITRSGQTRDQIKESIHNQLAREQWMDKQIADEIKVTPQEVEKFYQEGPPDKFDEPEKVSASHILIAVRRDAPPEETLAAEKRANDLVDRLKKGESFEDLAVQFSADPTAKKNKGYIGSFSREGIMPEFTDAAFKLKPGEISAPVRTQFGFHIIKVTEHKAPRTQTLDEARERITTYIQDQKRQKATAQLVQKLRDNSKIEIAGDLRDDPHTPAPAH